MKDVIVIGGGHAGVEASLSSARMGLDTILITLNKSMIAHMPCNPSIGGPAKGIVVREIDALGGEMGKNINKSLLQVKMLNQSKGPAVRSLRAQADKIKYPKEMLKTIESQKNLEVLEEKVSELIIENNICKGVILSDGTIIYSKSVVITSGTYLRSLILQGSKREEEGPDGEKRSVSLSESLKSNGIKMLRFKTGTPPRVHKNSIDWSKTQIQPGDKREWSFSYFNTETTGKNIPCYLTYTNEKTHGIIRNNLNEAPMFSGDIEGVGPRYCPSIEDKVYRFQDKERHQIFLEPESESLDSIYIQGLSSSFSEEIQDKFIRTIPGLENAKIMKYAYAIEYDVINPQQLNSTLEFKNIRNLFSAGQINGTSGYEEAAGQGIVAGINAALNAQSKDLISLSRTSSYIGTMIDDIVIKGVTDPYRLLTSRSEYRLVLRNDNAHLRLSKISNDIGLLKNCEIEIVNKQNDNINKMLDIINNEGIDSNSFVNDILIENMAQPLKQGTKLINLFRRPDIDYKIIDKLTNSFADFSTDEKEMVEVKVKYEGYINKMLSHIEKSKKLEKIKIPLNVDYSLIKSLSLESIDKLSIIRPETISQATRISGVTPSDISILQIHFSRK